MNFHYKLLNLMLLGKVTANNSYPKVNIEVKNSIMLSSYQEIN